MQPRFHRPARHAQNARRLGLVETVQIPEHEDGTLVGRQALEHAADIARHFRVGVPDGQWEVAGRNGTDPYRRARDADGLADRDGPHPPVKRVGIPERPQSPKYTDQRLLGRILTGLQGDRPADTPHVRRQRIEQLAHREDVALLSDANQLDCIHTDKRAGTSREVPASL